MAIKKKFALIIPGSIWYAPYVRNYTRILGDMKADYSIISWNREGDDKPEGFQYNVPCGNGHSTAGFSAYRGYIRFIKKTIREQGFNHLIVFGPQMTCLLSFYLLIHFRHKYIIDYRDLSIDQRPGVRQLFALMLKFSYANVISSPGFKRCLPKGNYYLSHNFDEHAVRDNLNLNVNVDANLAPALLACKARTPRSISAGLQGKNPSPLIDVLTIGAIRDFSSNIEVTKALANQEGFTLRFVGKGGEGVVEKIQEYCDSVEATNVSFVGSYEKPDEAEFVKSTTFLNIFYPRVITHDTALSNRFYLSLIYHKPMIVTTGTLQGDYAEKYKVGVALKNCCKLTEQLTKFLKQDYQAYSKRCDMLLKKFLQDQNQFVKVVKEFVKE